ncbi:MAG TPA: hypothetical protein DC034_14080 [Clostridium sp.]|uniref:hypothetical protein n=1 Tax=uncultured Clostridium sp. TaxID=59620 RepID=UPI000E8EA06A|nr:hypothetical protein [uncultured Clostridium sp.]HBC97906.1 hypothetical protein [Clostridium sp.]
MKSILYAKSDKMMFYNDNSFLGKIKDRFKIRIKKKLFIKELGIKIEVVKFPLNINADSYRNNILRAQKISKIEDIQLAPKIYRYLDYNLYNRFQRELMAFSIVMSSKIILRNRKKSIRHSCMVVYDASEPILFDTICFLAKEAKFIVLLSKNIVKINKIRQYITANYGVTPIVTSNLDFSFGNADFIITSEKINVGNKAYIWYLDNSYRPCLKSDIMVNDIEYKIPWDFEYDNMPFELLGSILCQLGEKNVEKALCSNGIFLNKIKFDRDELTL